MITDHQGNVVARGEPESVAGPPTGTASWTPSLDYHYAGADGKADFATEYTLEISPETPGGLEAGFVLEGVER